MLTSLHTKTCCRTDGERRDNRLVRNSFLLLEGQQLLWLRYNVRKNVTSRGERWLRSVHTNTLRLCCSCSCF
jgi:hypothetical protein